MAPWSLREPIPFRLPLLYLISVTIGCRPFFGAGFDATERGFGTQFGEFSATIVRFDVTAVPEPSSTALLIGLGMIGVVRRRK